MRETTSHPLLPLLAPLLGCALALSACEKREPPALTRAPSSPEVTEREAASGPLLIATITPSRVEPSPDYPWLPSDADVIDRATKKINEYKNLEKSDDSESVLRIAYGAMTLSTPGEPDRLALRASLTLEDAARGDQLVERLQVLDELPADDQARREALLSEVDDALSALDERRLVELTSDEALPSLVLERESLSGEAALDITQRLRKISSPPDAQRQEIVAALKELATREEPALLTAVLAGLVALAPEESGAALVEAATRMSSLEQWPAYIALLAQMGQVKDPIVGQYLQTVSSSHPNEQIRQIATESLAQQAEVTR